LASHQALPYLKKTQGEYGAGGWIRTIEAYASDLQSDPFGRSGTPAENRRHFPAQTSNCQSIFLINSQSYVKKVRFELELARGIEPPTG
jgi:hypothetical protein